MAPHDLQASAYVPVLVVAQQQTPLEAHGLPPASLQALPFKLQSLMQWQLGPLAAQSSSSVRAR